jgi:uncharacterized protein (DUF2147 family)
MNNTPRHAGPDPATMTSSAGLRIKSAMTALLLMASASVFSQETPVGLWHSIDDKTGEPKAEIRISDNGGVLRGRIEKLLRKGANPDEKCTECKDERKGQPMVGLEIIRGARKAPDKDVWEDGKILDPENGREYTLRLTPVEGGKRLDVRGSFGPFGRTQTWVRVP